MRRLRCAALAAAVTISGLMACGDDGATTPDAPVTPQDTGPSCTATALGAGPVFNDNSDDAFIAWTQDVTTAVGPGDAFVNFEFYDGIQTLSGAIDLAAGVQSNYKTCAACVRLVTLNAAGDAVEKQYFQSGGTLTLTEDPFTGRKMVGSTTDLTLVEVSINEDDFTSTPVAGGVCLSLGSLTLNADSVPAAWTCDKSTYDDGTTCNCECGAHDPDCDIDAAPVAGCTGAQVCGSEDTCIDVCNVLSTPPQTCPAGTCGYDTATRDICYTDATLVDPAALGGTCASATPLFCAVSNTVATGVCDKFETDNLACRKACDAAADCTAGQVCAALIGTKGLCVTPPANDTCATATALTLNTPVTGSTGGAASNYNTGLETMACTGVSQAGGDVAYTVTLTQGQAITVTLSAVSARFDPAVAILGPGTAAAVCDASPVTCLKGADAGLDGAGETFTYTAAAAGVHYIIVDTFYTTQGGSFTLNVTSP